MFVRPCVLVCMHVCKFVALERLLLIFAQVHINIDVQNTTMNHQPSCACIHTQVRVKQEFEIMFETGVDEFSWDDTVSSLVFVNLFAY